MIEPSKASVSVQISEKLDPCHNKLSIASVGVWGLLYFGPSVGCIHETWSEFCHILLNVNIELGLVGDGSHTSSDVLVGSGAHTLREWRRTNLQSEERRFQVAGNIYVALALLFKYKRAHDRGNLLSSQVVEKAWRISGG